MVYNNSSIPLETILETILAYGKTASLSPKDWTVRMEEIKHTIDKELFSRKDYMNFHKEISTVTASRDLKTRRRQQDSHPYGGQKQHKASINFLRKMTLWLMGANAPKTSDKF